jgi:hypothetical protein
MHFNIYSQFLANFFRRNFGNFQIDIIIELNKKV